MHSKLLEKVHALLIVELPPVRMEILKQLIAFIQSKVDRDENVRLSFICTHNSRRSQFAQIWAQTAADFFGVQVACLSGGVEVTALDPRAVAALNRSGFDVESGSGKNPVYVVRHSPGGDGMCAFSKLFDDAANTDGPFAAVMTCAHADENCPVITGAAVRLAVRYNDPKAFDDTHEEAARYDECSDQIAAEMFYVFSQISLPS